MTAPARTRDHHEAAVGLPRLLWVPAGLAFALIALPLVVLVFGIIKYVVYFWSVQGGSDAARQAARLIQGG